jgi:hypothetical protein
MDSASSLAYPGSRVLADWWRQLQPHRPASLWVGYLFVHRVEALVEIAESRTIDALSLHILEALAIDQRAPGPHAHGADPLPARLHLPAPALHQLLSGLEARDFVRLCEPGCWCLSERGREVLQAGADRVARRERRTLPFVERLAPVGRRLAPPHFLPLSDCPAAPWEAGASHPFDLDLLRQAVDQPPEWKDRHGFPTAVRSLAVVAAGEPDAAWAQVVVDRGERALIALVTAGDDRTVLGFAAQPVGWKLASDAPVLRMSGGPDDALPELTVPPSAWAEAWRLWCRQRHLPQSEADACRLSFDGIHLDVYAPAAFLERLRQAKSDALREDTGLLAGDGYLRAAALLRFPPPA